MSASEGTVAAGEAALRAAELDAAEERAQEPLHVPASDREAMCLFVQAMAAAQLECGPGLRKDAKAEVKDKETQRTKYEYTYATLGAVLQRALPIYNRHGLVLMQGVRGDDLVTTLAHVAGHMEEWNMPVARLLAGDNRLKGAQALGSAISFGRRYAALAALGLAPSEDDDGAAASELPDPEYVRWMAEKDAAEKKAKAEAEKKAKAERKAAFTEAKASMKAYAETFGKEACAEVVKGMPRTSEAELIAQAKKLVDTLGPLPEAEPDPEEETPWEAADRVKAEEAAEAAQKPAQAAQDPEAGAGPAQPAKAPTEAPRAPETPRERYAADRDFEARGQAAQARERARQTDPEAELGSTHEDPDQYRDLENLHRHGQ